MLGVVASVNDVFAPEPGKGQPVPLIVPYVEAVVPGFDVAFAQTGYIFCGYVALILLLELADATVE